MRFPKGAIQYYCKSANTVNQSIWELLNNNTELDEVGIIEQILFTFPLIGRTPYKGISQSYTPSSEKKCPLWPLWRAGMAQTVGEGSASIIDLMEIIESLKMKVCEEIERHDIHVILPLTGGLDSRFIASCIRKPDTVESFTFYSGPSSEVSVARKIAKHYKIRHQSISLNPLIYTNAEIFKKHLGMLQHYHAAIISIAQSINIGHKGHQKLLVHGFMGDPIFGSKAKLKKNVSKDEACHSYLYGAIQRYPFFAQSISKTITNQILDDLIQDYEFYDVQGSNATLEEILFLTRRQQMIYKIVDIVDECIPVFTPYASSSVLIDTALRLPQVNRISRDAFVKYLSKKSPVNPFTTSENPWGLPKSLANIVRRVFNYIQYSLEFISPTIRLSPFQHEQLRASVFFNHDYFKEKIKFFEALLQRESSWEQSLHRRFNATDFPYSCSSIGHAFQLIQRK